MEWKNVDDYEVSSTGIVRRKKPNGEYHVYSQAETTGGYLCCAGRNVHQWVAMAFLNHKPCGHDLVVHHKDGNRKNNNAENLEIVTQSKNIISKGNRKTSIYPFVIYCHNTTRFKIHMKTEGKDRYFGSFKNEDDAGRISKALCEIYRPELLELF